MMKYALNHSSKFLNYVGAFQLGMFRTLSSLAVETISFMVIFTSEDVMNTVFNFIGLVIIDRFDVYVYDAVRCVNFKQCLQPELLE